MRGGAAPGRPARRRCALLLALGAGARGESPGGELMEVAPEVASQLWPGSIVGLGRYVLAQKLCDLCHLPAYPWLQGATSDGLQLDWSASPPAHGKLVPTDGLRSAINSSLPQLPLLPEEPIPSFLPEVHEYSMSFARLDPDFNEGFYSYSFGHRLGKGSFGEAWRALSLDGSMREVVLKRIFVEQGEHVRRSGEREAYFGTVLQHRPHVARFLEQFEHQGPAREGRPAERELWLVFHNEGFSMTHHIWEAQPGVGIMQLRHTWWQLKQQQPVGDMVIRNLAHQLISSVAVAHGLNITHRDIKMSNVFISETWPLELRLGDWGSAMVVPPTEEVQRMYGPMGPTTAEETSGYEPPEAFFDEELLRRVGLSQASPWRAQAYDLWSLGVLLLELTLGTREVFQLDDRRWQKAARPLKQTGVPAERLGQARRVQALLDLCIVPEAAPVGAGLDWYFPPGGDFEPSALPRAPAVGGDVPGCSDEQFAELLRRRDAAGVGLPDPAGRDLIRRLLAWAPQDRISAHEALSHGWFRHGAGLPAMRPTRAGEKRPCARARGGDEALGECEGGLGCEAGTPELEGLGAAGWPLRRAGLGDCEEGAEEDEEDGEEVFVSGAEASAEPPQEAQAGGEGSALTSGCLGLLLHAGAYRDIGMRSSQEDRYAIHNLTRCSPAAPPGEPGGPDEQECREAGFVGLFDGHRGQWVAERLRRRLHEHLVADRAFPDNITEALGGAFATFDHILMGDSAGHAAASSRRPQGGPAGSTALVSVVSGCRLYLANLGDSRAVAAEMNPEFAAGPWPVGAHVEVRESRSPELQGQRATITEVRSAARGVYVVRLLRDGRDGALRPMRQNRLRLLSELRAVRLTEDHKPDTEGERRRIEALGGRVEPPSGGSGPWRVAGLATSRSFGSRAARPFVSAEPELRELPLDRASVVFVVLASDGVWDVLDDQFVVDLVWDLISSAHDARHGPEEALQGAAQGVVQAALEAGSLDNLSCVVLLLAWAGGAFRAGSE